MFLAGYDPTKNRGRFAIVPLDLIVDQSVSDGAVRLYAYLAAINLENNDPPRREQIAADLTITPTSVTNRVKELVARDWLIAWKHFVDQLHANAYQTFNNPDECRDYRQNHAEVRYVDFAGEIERRKIRRGNRGASNQIDDQTGSMIKPDGLTQQGQDQTGLPDHDQTGLPSYIKESDSFIQTEELVNKPSSNDSVAAATGVDPSQEERALPYDPNQPEADPTPSPDVLPPSPPSSAAPPASQQGVPEGYVARYAGGSGRTTHLVHVDATETVCGNPTENLLDAPKPGREYRMCPQCMAKLRPIARKPSIDQPVKDAIAEHLQAIPVNMATSHTGVLANVAINVWKRKLNRALFKGEYEGVARSIPVFVEDYRAKYPSSKLPTTTTGFEEHFTKFVASKSASKPQTESAPPNQQPKRRSNATQPHGDVRPEELTDEQLREKWS